MARPKLAKPNYRLYRRRRSGHWQLGWTDPATGRTKAVSTRQADRQQAEIWRDRYVACIAETPPEEEIRACAARLTELLSRGAYRDSPEASQARRLIAAAMRSFSAADAVAPAAAADAAVTAARFPAEVVSAPAQRRGPRPVLTNSIVARMQSEIAEGTLTLEELDPASPHHLDEEALRTRYGARSRYTVRAAREKVLSLARVGVCRSSITG